MTTDMIQSIGILIMAIVYVLQAYSLNTTIRRLNITQETLRQHGIYYDANDHN